MARRMMPGGDPDSWKHLKPIWEAVAAKVDPKTGKPIETYAPGKPVVGGVPCTAYIGPNGAGHYVKMVHNGIEYIDMQLIGEAYWLLANLLGMKPPELSKVFAQWNQGDLDCYLIQITADIFSSKIRCIPRIFGRPGSRRRRPEGDREMDQHQRAGHGHSRQRDRRSGFCAMPVALSRKSESRRAKSSKAPTRLQGQPR